MQLRPMLAVQADLAKLRYPLLVSPKLDGVRAIVHKGVLLSRTLKPIPNIFTQETFKHLEGYDGELIAGSATAWNCYRKTVSAVMTEDGSPLVNFHVFDRIDVPTFTPFHKRLESMSKSQTKLKHDLVNNAEELAAAEELILAEGYEGLILRDPLAPYKYGRSTLREGWMLKLKRFTDAEATVVGFEELMHNSNPATLDERGYTKHSHHQSGKVPMNTLGALVVSYGGSEFKLGTGFTASDRLEIWRHQSRYMGKLAKFKYFNIGMKNAPRHPVWLGWRDERDI